MEPHINDGGSNTSDVNHNKEQQQQQQQQQDDGKSSSARAHSSPKPASIEIGRRELESLTRSIRSDLAERSKDTVHHTARLVQEMLRGSRSGEYVTRAVKQFAFRESMVVSTAGSMKQMGDACRAIEAQIRAMDTRMARACRSLAQLQAALQEVQPAMQAIKRWENEEVQQQETREQSGSVAESVSTR